ncbi:MAG: DinB family protein [Acidobacteriaceae bacterium]
MPRTQKVLNPYAQFLNGQDPMAVIQATSGRLRTLAKAIGIEKINLAPSPGKWSAREILCHLADCEVAFGFRLRQTLAENNHKIQPFDQEKWAAPYKLISADDALATFAALRRWNVLLIDASLAANAGKTVTHPERGKMTFGTIVETMAGHDLNHIAQLERLAA